MFTRQRFPVSLDKTVLTMAGRTHLVLREEDVVKLVCEFLDNRAMTISQISLERESGVINGDLSDDIVFLRKIFQIQRIGISDCPCIAL